MEYYENGATRRDIGLRFYVSLSLSGELSLEILLFSKIGLFTLHTTHEKIVNRHHKIYLDEVLKSHILEAKKKFTAKYPSYTDIENITITEIMYPSLNNKKDLIELRKAPIKDTKQLLLANIHKTHIEVSQESKKHIKELQSENNEITNVSKEPTKELQSKPKTKHPITITNVSKLPEQSISGLIITPKIEEESMQELQSKANLLKNISKLEKYWKEAEWDSFSFEINDEPVIRINYQNYDKEKYNNKWKDHMSYNNNNSKKRNTADHHIQNPDFIYRYNLEFEVQQGTKNNIICFIKTYDEEIKCSSDFDDLCVVLSSITIEYDAENDEAFEIDVLTLEKQIELILLERLKKHKKD